MKHPENITIIGGGGAIGYAFAQELRARHPVATIRVFSRTLPQAEISGVSHQLIDLSLIHI